MNAHGRLLQKSFTSLALAWATSGLYANAELPVNSVPDVAREFRAVWIATVANIDWPSQRGLPSAQQQAELVALLDEAQRLHLNAVILQVRPACDALYRSDLEPWSEYLTGQMGQPPQPLWDPLEFAVAAAHARGLELHAWFNPYRAIHPAAKGPVADTHIARTHPELVREYGVYHWLDPGEPAAAAHSLAVIADVVQRYDIDGIHLDDYFYPYPIADDNKDEVPFPDDASWERADTEQEISRDDWRRQQVDRFVEQMYRQTKARKPWVKVGISPFGIWRPGHPPQIQGFDQYAKLYADARKWLAEGWVDYFTPQLYWRIGPPKQSYPALLAWWHEQNRHARRLWPGNYTSRWPADEIVAQVWVTRAQEGADGNVHFSMKALAGNRDGVADKLLAGPYRQPALVPEMPWLADAVHRPAAPTVVTKVTDDVVTVNFELPGLGNPWLWLVQTRIDHSWQTDILPGRRRDVVLERDVGALAVSAVNRVGSQGPVERVSVARPTRR